MTPLMRLAVSRRLSRGEWMLLAGLAVLFAMAVMAPALSQEPAYHRFADTRTLLGIPRAMDVLSSAGFAIVGLSGLALIARGRLRFASPAFAACALVCFVGLVVTAAASASYHLAPDDAGLARDRHSMVIVFAGILGMVATERISARAGVFLATLSLLAGTGSVTWWTSTGSVTPYAIVQFGGVLIVSSCLLTRQRTAGPRWGLLLVAYAAAKLCEHLDAQIFTMTGEWVSGHTLKHLFAALAAWTTVQPTCQAPVAGEQGARNGT